MPQFTVVCPACSSELTLSTRRLLLRVDAGTVTSGEVLFGCLSCRATPMVPLELPDVAALLAAHVTVLALSEPIPEHPECPPAGPALTADDLIDLHDALRTEGWLQRLGGVGC